MPTGVLTPTLSIDHPALDFLLQYSFSFRPPLAPTRPTFISFFTSSLKSRVLHVSFFFFIFYIKQFLISIFYIKYFLLFLFSPFLLLFHFKRLVSMLTAANTHNKKNDMNNSFVQINVNQNLHYFYFTFNNFFNLVYVVAQTSGFSPLFLL